MMKQKGFTYAEIMIVIIILGVLAAIALPSYRHMMNRMKRQEAEQVLLSVFGAQLDHRRDTGDYAVNSGTLDVDIPAMKHYKGLAVSDAQTVTCDSVDRQWLASVTENNDEYTLYVTTEGKIICDDCTASECRLMGYSPTW